MVLRKSILSFTAAEVAAASIYDDFDFSDLGDRQQGGWLLTFMASYVILDRSDSRIPFSYAVVAAVIAVYINT